MYAEYRKQFPKIGKRIATQQGEGKVLKHSILNSMISVELDDGKEVVVGLKDIKIL